MSQDLYSEVDNEGRLLYGNGNTIAYNNHLKRSFDDANDTNTNEEVNYIYKTGAASFRAVKKRKIQVV